MLSGAELEAAARGVSELGLTSAYTLNSSDYYSLSDEQDSVYVSLRFVCQSGSYEDSSYSYSNKEITLDAKTGAFVSSSAYAYSYKDIVPGYTRAQCEAKAEAFAQKISSEEYALTLLEDEEDSDEDRFQTFNFVRQANGIEFPENYICVTVDTSTAR